MKQSFFALAHFKDLYPFKKTPMVPFTFSTECNALNPHLCNEYIPNDTPYLSMPLV